MGTGLLGKRSQSKALWEVLWIIVFCILAFIGLMPKGVNATLASHVVISEIYGGGGNSGSTWKNDFIELYNPTDSTVSLSGWSIQYASATGAFSTNNTALSGSIGPHRYYLIQEAAGTGGTQSLPAPDVIGTINMSATAAKVALVNSTTAISGAGDAGVVDFVGYGTTASAYEGGGSAPAPGNTTSVKRKDNNGGIVDGQGNGWDTDSNNTDFVVAVNINPQNSSSPAEPDGPVPTPTEIPSPTPTETPVETPTETPTPTEAPGNGEYHLYFGQLHSHTTYSDGTGSPDEAFNYAKNTAKVDFLAVTDHSNSLDNASACSMGDGSKSNEWLTGHNIADSYTDSNFVGIYAFEMTWSNGTGHINTFNTSGFETRENQIYKNADGLQQYYNVLKQYPASISQFNHPGNTFGDFNDFGNYDPVIDPLISLIEVGNGEGAIGSGGYFPSYEEYTRALDKGWHLAPTNNQDNHLGHWGNANTARTVILAPSLSRANIYDAMKNRHCYATEDNNLRVLYTLNGQIMGTILPQKPAQVDIKVDLDDPDNEALGKVSIITNGGRVVASKTIAASKDSIEFNLSPDYSYYYIRVDEADKDIAVTAPVWISEVEKAGITRTTGSASLPLRGQKLTVTTGFFNNEIAPMIITGLEYSINGNVIHTAMPVNPVAPLGTGSYAFEYTPTVAGKCEINVKLTATINGVPKTYTDVLTLNVADPAITTNVVVDASHYNDYVSGYYAGNMSNLVTLANNESINVVIQSTPLTDLVLEDAQLLILSPPAKKNGTAGGQTYTATPYTDQEIAVIKRFADRGGNIIMTALADYQDNRNDITNHSAYQQNRILEAIGAGSRFNDDEVVDYENNPNANNTKTGGTYGTPYRAPMNVYDMSSPYLTGVQSSQNYSFYSGCSFNLGNNAVWLVKGTPTTYGFNSDNDQFGGSYVSNAAQTIPADTGIGKGNVVGLAAEILPGGGKLFIGGTVFYSNFEIKVQLDNYGQPQNSNYNITMNILDSIKKVIPVTTIAHVRTAQIGDTYCVEGIVTAGTEPGNAFFDTIYIQDSTGGLDIYPVSGVAINVGQKVKVTGTVDEYQGDRELRVIELSVTDTVVSPVTPVVLSTHDAMLEQNEGWLVKVTGTVTKMVNNNLYLNDGSGEARVFLDGYIGDGTANPDALGKWDPAIAMGDTVGVIGLASQDGEGHRIRVRNSAEIVRVDSPLPVITGRTTTSPNANGWFNHDVTVHYETVDPFHLVEYITPDVTLSTEGAAQSVTGIARNIAGKTGTCTVDNINIDKTAPSLKASVSGGLNELGWYNTDVAVHWITEDQLSGIDVVSPDGLLTQEGAGQTLTGKALDKAGNSAEMTVSGINIDKTRPIITVTLADSYRLGKRLKWKFTTQDAISGVASSNIVYNGVQYANGDIIQLTQAGRNTVDFIARDNAGNIEKITKTFNVVVPVEIHVMPGIINLKGRNDHWNVLMTVRLPENVSYAAIQLNTIRINGAVVPVSSRNLSFEKRASRHHRHGEIAAILMKFDKDDLKTVLKKGVSQLTITGSTNCFDFEGECKVLVIE